MEKSPDNPPLPLRFVVRQHGTDVFAHAETLEGLMLRHWVSSDAYMAEYDIFRRPSSEDFWKQRCPHGYKIVERVTP